MIGVVQEFFEVIYWKLRQVLDREGISVLQWAFMQRALYYRDGVAFSHIMEVTGESKDNVRRAAAGLDGFATVVPDSRDRRARKLVLTKRGRRRSRIVMMRFEKEMFNLLGARDERSQRVRDFKHLLWDASAFLTPSDLADQETVVRSRQNRRLIFDDSPNYTEEDPSESIWLQEETPDDQSPW